MPPSKQKRRNKNITEKSVPQRLLLGLRVGLLSAAAMLGMVFLFVIAYGLIFPDKPLPNFTFRGGRPNLTVDENAHRKKLAEPVEYGFDVFGGPDGGSQLHAGLEIHNPHNEELIPFYVVFEFFDDDNEIITKSALIATMGADETLYLSSEIDWHEDAPTRLEVRAQGSDSEVVGIPKSDLKLTHGNLQRSGDDHQILSGIVENTSTRMTKGLAVHCVYYQDGTLIGGIAAIIGQVFSGAEADWEMTVPPAADEVKCSALDRSAI